MLQLVLHYNICSQEDLVHPAASCHATWEFNVAWQVVPYKRQWNRSKLVQLEKDSCTTFGDWHWLLLKNLHRDVGFKFAQKSRLSEFTPVWSWPSNWQQVEIIVPTYALNVGCIFIMATTAGQALLLGAPIGGLPRGLKKESMLSSLLKNVCISKRMCWEACICPGWASIYREILKS